MFARSLRSASLPIRRGAGSRPTEQALQGRAQPAPRLTEEQEVEVAEPRTRPRVRARRAPRYKVLIHNDDVTPMDFVVHVLQRVFSLPLPRAVKVMLEAHLRGIALVAVLPLEQAEFRVEQAHGLARARGYPLTFSYEPE